MNIFIIGVRDQLENSPMGTINNDMLLVLNYLAYKSLPSRFGNKTSLSFIFQNTAYMRTKCTKDISQEVIS